MVLNYILVGCPCWLRAEIKELHSFISIDILNYISVWRSGRKKSGRNEEGEMRVTSPPPHPHAVLVSAHFSFRRLLHQNAWSRLLWRYSSVTARKKDTKIMTVLFAGADRKRSLYCLPDFKFNWSNNFKFNDKYKKLELLLVYLDHEHVAVNFLFQLIFIFPLF